MIKKIFLTGLGMVLITGVALPASARADNGLHTGWDKVRDRIEVVMQNRIISTNNQNRNHIQVVSGMCNVSQISNQLQTNDIVRISRDNFVNTFHSMENMWLKMADRMDAKGFDTHQLRQNISDLDQKIANLSADYDDVISKQEALNNMRNGNANDLDNAANQLSEANQKLQNDISDIHNFIQTTLVPDVNALVINNG
jgi:chromosome segregation ATPase